MIRAHADVENGRMLFVVRGHAGAAPKGEDLVCAAATILARALGETVKGDKEVRIEDGVFALNCELTEQNKAYFDVAAKGFRLLAKQYPEFVNFF